MTPNYLFPLKRKVKKGKSTCWWQGYGVTDVVYDVSTYDGAVIKT